MTTEAPPQEETSTAPQTGLNAPPKPAEQDTPKPDETTTTAETTVEEAEASLPAWASLKTEDEVLGHEAFKPHLEKVREEARIEGRAENRRVQSQLERQNVLYTKVDKDLVTVAESIQEMLGAKDEETGRPLLSEQAVANLVKRHSEAFDALGGVERARGMYGGYDTFVARLASVVKSQQLSDDYLGRINDLKQGVHEQDATFFDDLLADLTREAVKPLKDRIAELEAAVSNKDTELRAAKRGTEKPPADMPAGGGGSRSREAEDKMLLDPETPIGTIKEIMARRASAG